MGIKRSCLSLLFQLFRKIWNGKNFIEIQEGHHSIAVLMLMFSRKKRSRKLTADQKQRKMMLIMGCMHLIKRINAAIAKKVVDMYSPPPGDDPHGLEDNFGDYNLFNSCFLFRKHNVLHRGYTFRVDFFETRILAKQILFSCVISLN
jgi:hypothetical protein